MFRLQLIIALVVISIVYGFVPSTSSLVNRNRYTSLNSEKR